jgi:hypothetical protein
MFRQRRTSDEGAERRSQAPNPAAANPKVGGCALELTVTHNQPNAAPDPPAQHPPTAATDHLQHPITE